MPDRFCICPGCPACTPEGCRARFDRDATGTWRCPPCQAVLDTTRRARRNNGKAPTAQRGYGGPHQAERRRRVRQHQEGNPCAIGGEPLPADPRLLHLAHDHAGGGYLPGLACAYHNETEGARRGGGLNLPRRTQ